MVKLVIKNAPSLVDLSLDNCQRVGLMIDPPAAVEAIHGLIGSGDDPHARLTSLQINGQSKLTFLSADVSDCSRWNLELQYVEFDQDVAQALPKLNYGLSLIDLSTAKDPEREPYQYGRTLRLHGRKITTKDLDLIRPLKFDLVDLRGCEITPDALKQIQADTSDTSYELDSP